MSEVKHTAGPWEWKLRDDDFGPVYTLGPRVLISDYGYGTPWGDEIDKANARLIASAPDLLEALKAMVKFCDLFPNAEYHVKARAAIAKAEGRS